MFKKSRMKIIALIMTILILILMGTLCAIYFVSYMDVNERNRQMLERYTEEYKINGVPDEKPLLNHPPELNRLTEELSNNRRFQVSTFYSVAFSKSGEVLEISNDVSPLMSDDELASFAQKLTQKNNAYGTVDNMAYLITDEESYTLVVLMDNIVIWDSISTLVHYTLIFGMIAIVFFFFLSLFFSNWIIQPLEKNYKKQKQFISDAGHELKTPISIINANAELLSREIGDNQWLSNIQFENQRMSEMVHQLLELAKAENINVPMEKVDLSRIVTGGILPFESLAFDQGLSLSYSIPDQIQMTGNAGQLGQLIAILIDNAIQHSEYGGKIEVSMQTMRNTIVLWISNQGEEIPPQQRDKIFDRFYQVDPSHSNENHYGLGLAIAKAIVTIHHGKIKVDCQNHTTTFTVTLPTNQRKLERSIWNI